MHSAFAPAKVNLFLHVGAVADDGYHPVHSLMVFADVGDRITLSVADHPVFEVDGPFSTGLTGGDLGAGGDNLVTRAYRALMQRSGGPWPPCRLVLTKRLPIAAGLGGGSSDAGAALRLLRDGLGLPLDDAILLEIASELGADGAACFTAAPVMAQGRGEQLSAAPRLPPIDAVLVNPRRPCSTGAVYKAFDSAPPPGPLSPGPTPDAFEDVQTLAAVLASLRNDLEAPAITVEPMIGEVLDLLRTAPETLLARVSGSGATCFALTAGRMEAEGLAQDLARLRPDWWVTPCRLGGPWG